MEARASRPIAGRRGRPPFGHEDHGLIAGAAGVRHVPGGHVDRGGIDGLHVDHVRGPPGRLRVPPSAWAATQDQHVSHEGRAGAGCVLRIGHHEAERLHAERAAERSVVEAGAHQHRDRAEAAARGDHGEVARPPLHEHAHAIEGAHPAGEEAAHHVVDADVGVAVRERAPPPEEEGALRDVARLLGEREAGADPGVVVEPAQPEEPRELVAERDCGVAEVDARLAELVPCRAERLGGHVVEEIDVERLDDGGRRWGRPPNPRPGGVLLLLLLVGGGLRVGRRGQRGEQRRTRALTLAPVDPREHGGPGEAVGVAAHHQPEVTGRERHLERGGRGRRPGDGADRARAGDLVADAHEVEHRRAQVGERHRAPVDDEAARHHPVVDDELVDEGAQGRPRPGHEALAAEEAPPRLALHQRLPVVELLHEVDELPHLLAHAHQLEGGRGEDAGQPLDALQRGFHQGPHQLDQAARDLGADVGQVLVDVDRAAEGDDRTPRRTPRPTPPGTVTPPPGKRTCRPASSPPGARRAPSRPAPARPRRRRRARGRPACGASLPARARGSRSRSPTDPRRPRRGPRRRRCPAPRRRPRR